MHTGLLTADVDGILFRTLPDFFGGFFHAVGQDIAEAFSLNNLLGQRHDRLMIPPFQVDAAGILLRQNTGGTRGGLKTQKATMQSVK